MKDDQKFRTYYYRMYDLLRLLYRRIYDESPVTIIQAEKHWLSKLDHGLEEERGALERCEEEITARRARFAWYEQIKADELKDRNLWRQKVKKHVKRKANISEPSGDKRWKIEESSLDLEKSSPGMIVRLISESCETVMKDILDLISEHSGSEELN